MYRLYNIFFFFLIRNDTSFRKVFTIFDAYTKPIYTIRKPTVRPLVLEAFFQFDEGHFDMVDTLVLFVCQVKSL